MVYAQECVGHWRSALMGLLGAAEVGELAEVRRIVASKEAADFNYNSADPEGLTPARL